MFQQQDIVFIKTILTRNRPFISIILCEHLTIRRFTSIDYRKEGRNSVSDALKYTNNCKHRLRISDACDMGLDSKLLQYEDSLKEKHLSIFSKQAIEELKKIKKHEYKKTLMNELGGLLTDCQKQQYDQTALCIVNFLQREVINLVRNKPSSSPRAQFRLVIRDCAQ